MRDFLARIRIFWTMLAIGSMLWLGGQAGGPLVPRDWSIALTLAGALLWVAALVSWPQPRIRGGIDGWVRPATPSPSLFALAVVPIVAVVPMFLNAAWRPIDTYRDQVATGSVVVALGLTIVRVA